MLWQTTAALARVFGNHDALGLVGVDHACTRHGDGGFQTAALD
jgi:hypothetical protein